MSDIFCLSFNFLGGFYEEKIFVKSDWVAFSSGYVRICGGYTIIDVDAFTGISWHKDVNDVPYSGNYSSDSTTNTKVVVGTYKDTVKVRTWDFGVEVKSLIDDAIYVRLNLKYGKVGKPKESTVDHLVTINSIANPNVDTSNATGKSKGNIFDCALNIGYKLEVTDNISVIPFVGLKYFDEKIKSYIPDKNVYDLGMLDEGSHNASWNGPEVGFLVSFEVSDDFYISLNCSYGFLSYKKDIKHGERYLQCYNAKKRMGSAFFVDLSGEYKVNEDCAISLGYSFAKKSAKPLYTLSTSYIPNALSTTFSSNEKVQKGKASYNCHVGTLSFIYNF